MRQFTTILLILFSTPIFSQILNNTEQDTTKAHQYYHEVISSNTLDKDQKVDLLQKSIVIYDKYGKMEEVIRSKSYLAYTYSQYNDTLDITTAKQTIQLAETHFSDDMHPNLQYAYMALQISYTSRFFKKAVLYGQKAHQLSEKPSHAYFSIISNLITDLRYDYQLDEAIKLAKIYQQELENTTDSTHFEWWNNFYICQMGIHHSSENYEKVILYGKKFMASNSLYPSYFGKELAPPYVYISNGYQGLKNYKEAIKWNNKAINIITKTMPNSPDLGGYYANMASLYQQMKNWNRAIDYYDKALNIMIQAKDRYAGSIATTYQNMAVAYNFINDYDQAEITIKKAYNYSDAFFLDATYATILSYKKEYNKSLQYFQKALLPLCPTFNSKDIEALPSEFEAFYSKLWAASILFYKARTLYEMGLEKQSIKWLNLSIQHAELSAKVYAQMQEQLKGYEASKTISNSNIMKTFSLLNKVYYEYLEIEPNKMMLNKAFENMERQKAMQLLETLTPSFLPKAYAKEEKRLIIQKRKYEQKMDFVTSDSLVYYQNLYFDTTLKIDSFLKKITKKFPKKVSNFYNVNYTKVEEIQATLREESLVIEYAYHKGKELNNLYIFLISKTDKKIIKVEIDDTFLDNINALNKLLKNPFLIQLKHRKQFINTSNKLYQVLIQPIQKELENKSQLIIIPQSDLFYIPFEVLLPSTTIRPFHELNFLVKDFDISYQYSATIYQQLKLKPAIRDKSLLAFAPVFDNNSIISTTNRSSDFMVDSLYQSIEKNKFISLPNSKKEVEGIAQIIKKNSGKTHVLLKEKATKQQLQSDLKSPYQFVHIATHGLVNYQNPRLSALACYSNRTKVGSDLLFANEIQMQDIQADLVILSSCESGIGQLIRGEGLIALNRSFIYSGVNNVMFSLWKVNDEHTSNLMIDFYQFYMKNDSYTKSLRQAKLKMLKHPITANPRFWAAFILIGE